MPVISTDLAALERLVSPAGHDVLDVGCGTGALVRELAGAGAHVTGLEISEQQLVAARQRDPDGRGRYRVGTAERLPFASASVDLVVFLRALHHVDAMVAALAEARRVLRHGGAVYVAEPLAAGSFFALVSLVEDETEVRRAAQDALVRAGEAGLRREATLDYDLEGRYDGVARFRAHMLSVDPDRAARFDARRAEIEGSFEQLGEPGATAGERRFLQRMRADLLRPDRARAG